MTSFALLSLLMAFGGQTGNSDPYYTGHGNSGLVGTMRGPCDDVERPEISLHPYPLWRIEAQEPQHQSYVCTGSCMTMSQAEPIFAFDPIDVPAVQESPCKLIEDEDWCRKALKAGSGCLSIGSLRACQTHWTCTDPSRSLESSVDGLKHWCHRMTD